MTENRGYDIIFSEKFVSEGGILRTNSFARGAETPVGQLYGIGEKRAEALSRAGIKTALDLAYHFPRGYEPRGNVRTVKEVYDGQVCSLVLIVASNPSTANIRRGMTLTKLVGYDETGRCHITFFNQPYLRDTLPVGTEARFYGKIERRGEAVSMSSPAYEIVRGSVPLRALVPVYPLVEGISQKLMGCAVRSALDLVFDPTSPDALGECLPLDLRKKYNLCDIKYALRAIHTPVDTESLARARRRLAFEEIYRFALLAALAGKGEKTSAGRKFPFPDRKKFLACLPFDLTEGQRRTFDEIERDMTGGAKMNRLVTGDVGSGKTVCAAYAAYIALEAGTQAAIMAPTEILARQHFLDLKPLFEKLGYECELLVGATTAAAKKKITSALCSGKIRLIIGTHALIEDTVLFEDLGVIIIDEQHRFGAAQREKLAKKSDDCHTLTMSATPIPRTLALVLYGGLDISTLDTMPPGRQTISTFVVDESYRERLNGFIRKNVAEGGQVYIVCPAVEDQEEIIGEGGEKVSALDIVPIGETRDCEIKLKTAVDFAKQLSEEVFPDLRVGFIHGKLKSTQKEKVMAEFVAGNIDILVSTTVIEVGVNVPTATLMIVENAEFFGLSQLHQLRGRVGRGSKKSYCILVSDSKSEKAKARLEVMRSTRDGYKIAERDLEIRGPGDFIAQSGGKVRQSGGVDMKIAALVGDTSLLYAAFDAAAETIAADPTLSSERNIEMKKRITRRGSIEN